MKSLFKASILTLLVFLPLSSFAESPEGVFNGFLGQTNILECENHSQSDAWVQLRLFSLDGDMIHDSGFAIPANGSKHSILNTLVDITNNYGNVVLETGSNNYINCRTIFYGPNPSLGEKRNDFVYSIPVSSGTSGERGGLFTSLSGLSFPSSTYNWLTISNSSNSNFSAFIEFFNSAGQKTGGYTVDALRPGGRQDISLGNGSSGSYVVHPDNNSQSYKAYLVQFGADNSSSLNHFAFPSFSRVSDCGGEILQASTMGTAHTKSWVDVANLEGRNTSLELIFRDQSGAVLDSKDYSLGANAKLKVPLNTIIDPAATGNIGTVELVCSSSNDRLVAQVVQAGSHDGQSATWTYAVQSFGEAKASNGQVIGIPINTFLSSLNWVKFFNSGSGEVFQEYSVFDAQGTETEKDFTGVAKGGSVDINAGSSLAADSVGLMEVSGADSSSVNASLLRTFPDSVGRISNILYVPGVVLGGSTVTDPGNGSGSSSSSPGIPNSSGSSSGGGSVGTSDPVVSVSDYACTATPSGNNVVLSLSGVRAGSENLWINDVWRASLTGEAGYTVTNLDISATIEIRLRGNGYDGPSGFAVATCERAPAQTPAPDQTPAPAGLELVWSDDFDGTAIDPTKWEVFIGDYGTPHRVQSYTNAPENVRVENGALILEATLEDGQWYSGMVNTNDVRGPDAARWATGNLGWTFGRFEIRARVPHATGMWPALWMRPINYIYGGGWPLNGEIDILEYIGPDRNPASPNAPINELIANAHWEQDGKRKQRKGTFDLGGPQAAAAFVSEWHTYAVEWTQQRLEYFVDGQSYHVIENWVSDTGGIGPFDQNFDIIMNLQVGGWPGDPVPSSAGSQMEIDWVRVYQDNSGE